VGIPFSQHHHHHSSELAHIAVTQAHLHVIILINHFFFTQKLGELPGLFLHPCPIGRDGITIDDSSKGLDQDLICFLSPVFHHFFFSVNHEINKPP